MTTDPGALRLRHGAPSSRGRLRASLFPRWADQEVRHGSALALETPVSLLRDRPARRMAPLPPRRVTPNVRAGVLVLVADVVGLLLPALLLTDGRLAVAGFAVLAVGLFLTAGLYRSKLHLSVLDELPTLVSRTAAAAVVVSAAVHFVPLQHSVDGFLLVALAGSAGQLLLRAAAYRVVRRSRATGRIGHSAVLVGSGTVAAHLARTLQQHPEYGLRPVGTVDDDPLVHGSAAPVPCLGTLADLPEVLRRHEVGVVIVSFGRYSEPGLVDVLRASEDARCEVFVVPRLYEIHDRDVTDHVGAVPVVRMRRQRLRSVTWRLKRVFDVLTSGAALLALSPLLALIALAVRWEGGPGVLFRQMRIGMDGHEFEVLKFRSLKPVDDAESATNWNIAHDDRLGPVGKVLRRTSLDELPQLWNVLRGDMSVVGPRPERPHFVEVFTDEHPRYHHRHRVPSGLTGLAQVNGLRGDTSIGDRARFDNYYIEHWSLWLDIKIILLTVREVIGARGG